MVNENQKLLRSLSELDKHSQRAEEIEEELVKRNIGLVKSIAKDFLHSGEEFDDLVQAGYIGLLNAMHNYDFSKGAKFSTYATHLIKGEIRHYIRDKHGEIRLPAWVQELNYKVRKAEENFFHQEGRLPTLAELADRLDMEEEGVKEILKARKSMQYISIDQERRKQDPRPTLDLSKIKGKEEKGDIPLEIKVKIAQAIEKLSQVQQEVIKGLFYEEKTQTEMGERVGYSQRHISRLKNKALEEIKKELDGGEEGEN